MIKWSITIDKSNPNLNLILYYNLTYIFDFVIK